MKKTVAIITMHKVINFGSAMQAYALFFIIQQLGFDALLIDYLYPNDFHKERFVRLPIRFNSIYKRLKSKIIFYLLCKRKKQIDNFRSFWMKYFHETIKYNSLQELKNDPPISDIYVTGSDQVWNPQTMFGDPAFFLQFGDKKVKRIAYGASFGKNKITRYYKNIYRTYLKDYNYLGIREEDGANFVKQLTNRPVSLVCDPTLLLKASDYSLLTKSEPRLISRPYLLAYLLDYAYSPYPAAEKIISKISKLLHLHVVYLICGNTCGFKLGSSTITSAGPIQFLRLFQDASYVVTSSFHGTAFSLIYEKPFFSILPSSNDDSRISSLLKDVGLSERGIPSDKYNDSFVKEHLHMNFAESQKSLDKLRNSSFEFLKNSLFSNE